MAKSLKTAEVRKRLNLTREGSTARLSDLCPSFLALPVRPGRAGPGRAREPSPSASPKGHIPWPAGLWLCPVRDESVPRKPRTQMRRTGKLQTPSGPRAPWSGR